MKNTVTQMEAESLAKIQQLASAVFGMQRLLAQHCLYVVGLYDEETHIADKVRSIALVEDVSLESVIDAVHVHRVNLSLDEAGVEAER